MKLPAYIQLYPFTLWPCIHTQNSPQNILNFYYSFIDVIKKVANDSTVDFRQFYMLETSMSH